MLAHLALGLVTAMAPAVSAQDDFIDHGVGAPVAESRGVACLQDGEGRSVAICCMMDSSPRGWIIMTDTDTGETEQVYYPEGVPNSPPFASLMSDNGRFYTVAGKVLLEFDPTTREWLFSGTPAPGESAYTGRSICDAPDGLVYGGSYPNCKLISFDPETKEMNEIAQLDPREHYVNSLCADDTGWLYAGIGTARCNVVACNPKTGEVVQIADEAARTVGSGSVYPGQDGKVYGVSAGQSYRMYEGTGEKIEEAEKGPRAPSGSIEWGSRGGSFPDGRRLKLINLPERYMEVADKVGEVKRLEFDYDSEGAIITSVAAGPGGRVYASSCHPMHLISYDPEADELGDLGPVKRVGGGNFCAMATIGKYLFGAAYAGGFLYRHDTTKPWTQGEGDDANPELVAQWAADIARPRTCIAHPDGEHVVMAGFMGYGRRGGGMGIYNNETGEATLIEHTDLIEDHSTICLKALPDGNLVGGTSIHTPGGGHATAKEGVLYILDWETKDVAFRIVPVPGASEVWSLEVGHDGMVYGLASGSKLFVFDPEKRQVVHQADLSEYGGLPRHLVLLNIGPSRPAVPLGGLPLRLGDTAGVWAALGKAIVRIKPKTYEIEKIADTPVGVGAGAACIGDRLYFASASHLWSYKLPAVRFSFGDAF